MTKLQIDFLIDFDKPTLVEELQRLAHELKKDTLTRSEKSCSALRTNSRRTR